MTPTGSTYFLMENSVLKEQNAALKMLCARAADALEEDHEVIKDWFASSRVRDKHLPLIAELRKAAQ